MTRSPDRILDELLVLKCQDGDVGALEQLVSRWHARLRRHAWCLTQDHDATADIVQDAWLEIVRSIRRLREPASFRGWAYRIVGNKAADWIRRKKRDRATHLQTGSLPTTAVNPEFSPHSTDDARSLVRAAVRALPAMSQQVLQMKYLDSMSTREIAVALGVPVGTVKSRLYHARERLRRALETKGQ